MEFASIGKHKKASGAFASRLSVAKLLHVRPVSRTEWLFGGLFPLLKSGVVNV
jgi:hypothetical protein